MCMRGIGKQKKVIETGRIVTKWSVSLLSYVCFLIINGILVSTRPFRLFCDYNQVVFFDNVTHFFFDSLLCSP